MAKDITAKDSIQYARVAARDSSMVYKSEGQGTCKVAQAFPLDGGTFEVHTFNIMLPPGGLKKQQQLTNGVATFTVIEGDALDVKWSPPDGSRDTTLTLGPRDHFYVSRPNTYEIRNVGATDAYISVTISLAKDGQTRETEGRRMRIGNSKGLIAEYCNHFKDKK